MSAYFFEQLFIASQTAIKDNQFSVGLPVHWLINEIWTSSGNASTQAAIIVLSACLIYLAGQLISSIANFFLDRIFVHKCYGYPYEHLLLAGIKERVFVDYFSRRYYRGSIFWLHVAAFFYMLHGIYNSCRAYLWVAWICTGIFLCVFVIRIFTHSLYKKYSWAESILKPIIKLYVLPYKMLINPIQKINQTAKPMQQQVVEKYKSLFKKDFQIDPEFAESDNYWLSLYYVRQKDPRMSQLVHRWHQTSVFARNMAASFYTTFCYSSIVLWYETLWKNHPIQSPHDFRIAVALSGLFVLAMFLVIRFYYFYVSYYSKCLFRAFVFLHFDRTQTTAEK